MRLGVFIVVSDRILVDATSDQAGCFALNGEGLRKTVGSLRSVMGAAMAFAEAWS